jgi:hypothetical protein
MGGSISAKPLRPISPANYLKDRRFCQLFGHRQTFALQQEKLILV